MASAQAALEAELFARLDAAITGAAVFQDVPENTLPPFVVIGELRGSPLGGKDDPDRRIIVDIITVVSAEERGPLLDLQEQIEAAIDDKTFDRDGWTLSITLDSATAALGEDGQTYVGTSTFSVLALTA